MKAPWNAPISDRFSSLCPRVFFPAATILESEKTLGTKLAFFKKKYGFGGCTKISFKSHTSNSTCRNEKRFSEFYFPSNSLLDDSSLTLK